MLADSTFSQYLDAKTEFVSTLWTFRDFYLHPAAENAAAEGDFLSAEGSYNNGAQNFSSRLTSIYLEHGSCYQHELRDILFGLPDVERLVCIMLFLKINLKRMDDYGDLEGMRKYSQAARRTRMINSRSVPEGHQVPTAKPKGKGGTARVLAGLMNEVSPSGPELRFTDLEPRQTPMSPWLLKLLVSGKRPNSYGQSRTANHVRKNVGGLVRILATAGVLVNDAATNLGRHTFEGLAEELAAVGSDELGKSPSRRGRTKRPTICRGCGFPETSQHGAALRTATPVCWHSRGAARGIRYSNSTRLRPRRG